MENMNVIKDILSTQIWACVCGGAKKTGNGLKAARVVTGNGEHHIIKSPTGAKERR